MDSIICTYVIEDTHFSEPEGLALAGSMGAKWYFEKKSDPLYDEWITSGYRKHFRRAKPSAFNKLIQDTPGALISSSISRLWASNLMRSEDISSSIRRLQMSNFTLDASQITDNAFALVEVVVNNQLEMSFGKAAAAAAHATQNLAVLLEVTNSTLLDPWRKSGFAITASRGVIVDRATPFGSVQDFGLTEVPAGSTTAQAFITDSYFKDN